MGLLLMMLSRLAGATLLASDPMPERRAKSLALGAAAAFDPSEGRLVEQMRARTEGRGADAVIVAVPFPASLAEGLAAARPGGRVLLFAQNDPRCAWSFPQPRLAWTRRKSWGAIVRHWISDELCADLVFSRELPVAQLITHRFPLEEFERDLALAARPDARIPESMVLP